LDEDIEKAHKDQRTTSKLKREKQRKKVKRKQKRLEIEKKAKIKGQVTEQDIAALEKEEQEEEKGAAQEVRRPSVFFREPEDFNILNEEKQEDRLEVIREPKKPKEPASPKPDADSDDEYEKGSFYRKEPVEPYSHPGDQAIELAMLERRSTKRKFKKDLVDDQGRIRAPTFSGPKRTPGKKASTVPEGPWGGPALVNGPEKPECIIA